MQAYERLEEEKRAKLLPPVENFKVVYSDDRIDQKLLEPEEDLDLDDLADCMDY
jgi:hypothetical protein